MSSVGKVFIIANLVLAAIFVGSAASLINTSGEYRQKHQEAVAEMEALRTELEGQISDLQSEFNTVSGQKDRLTNEKTSLDAAKKALDGELETERQQNADLRESLNTLTAKLGDLEQTNRTLNNQKGEVEAQLRTLITERDGALDERDAALSESTAAMEEARIATNQVEDLRRRWEDSQERARDLEAQLAAVVREYGVDLSNISPQPDLEGVVLNASYTGGAPVVLINLGKRQGVRPGHTFDVFAGGTYKGQVRVDVVNESNSAATISLPTQFQISKGDRVATRI